MERRGTAIVEPRPASPAARSLAAPLVAFLCVAACCAVAILNGFPLLFSDTAAYIAAGVGLHVPRDRPIFYGLFLRPLLFADLWPVVVLQSAIIVYVLLAVTRIVCREVRASQFAAIIVVLCAISPLPWVAGHIIPDIFAPVVVLGIFAIFFAGDETGRLERGILCGLTAFAISTHLSHIPLAIIVVVACAVCRVCLCGPAGLFRRAAISGAIIAVAVIAISASNFMQTGKPTLSRGSAIFGLAKLLESGVAQAYLSKACPEAELALCALADEPPLGVNKFLWTRESPLHRLGGPQALAEEAQIVVNGTVAEFPLRVLKASASSALAQFVSFSVASGRGPESIRTMLDPGFGQRLNEGAENSRQGRGTLPFSSADKVIGAGLLMAAVAAGSLLALGMRPRTFALLAAILTGLVANAAICGTLSVVDGRYQARIIWLVTFLGLIAILEFWTRRPASRERAVRAAS
jgi:hypothetical protein